MKGKFKKNSKKKKKTNVVLHKYMVAVDDFLKSKSVTEEEESVQGLRVVKQKSRKELRKETRKNKKARMKCYYEGKKKIDGENSEIVVDNPQQQKKKKGAKAKKEVSKSSSSVPDKPDGSEAPSSSKKSKKLSKLQQSRKRALLEANEEEDREIKRLERRLGLNKRKNKKTLPQSFSVDGLDYILGVLDSGSSAAALYDEDDGDEDMEKAVDNFEKLDENNPELSDEDGKLGDEMASEGSDEEMASFDDEDEVDGDDDDDDGEDDEDADDETVEEKEVDAEPDESDAADSGNENDGEKEEEADAEDTATSGLNSETDTRSNVQVNAAAGKYVPPHLRGAGDEKRKAELEKLKRTVKGLMNRLTEPNMASISGQLEELYMSCSRKDMNDTLTEVLLAACVTPSLMPDRLLMEHVLLVSIVHHAIGIEVGANFLESVVRKFDEVYNNPTEGKECDNLVAIVGHLYNFQVVHSVLIVDILKRFVGAFTEKDIELVLLVLRNVGFSLRKDDALALKELISEGQRKARDLGSTFQDQTRVRFMLETMLALKNNDMRKIPGYDPEPMERLKKLQRTLIQRRAGGSDMKLRVSLDNLLAAEHVGRWWIVGSSWSGAPMNAEQGNAASTGSDAGGQFSAKVLDLARKQRMNTDVRRNIFCVIMTSEDYLDAFEKLIRMGLKDKQEREIVHVLMDCCLQEKTFNAYYAVLGEKFCSHDRRFQMTFQFSLWDKFRELANLPSSTMNNLIQLVTLFLQRKCLSLSILKVIEFGELDKATVRFLRHVLTKLLNDMDPEDLAGLFGRISGIPKLGMLREGLKLFISHFLLKNAKSRGPAEQAATLSERAQVATKAMEAKLKL
ncbi:nucleolar MIF4G domain-containing protein 1 isoform X2 [Gasterosteus aculeatus]